VSSVGSAENLQNCLDILQDAVYEFAAPFEQCAPCKGIMEKTKKALKQIHHLWHFKPA
jgi:hypothetical protein